MCIRDSYSRAYLHHLFKAEEILGQVLLSWHNTAFFQALMSAVRAAISEGRLDAFRRDFRERQTAGGVAEAGSAGALAGAGAVG